MDNIDNTGLYIFGDNTAGETQLHRCGKRDSLREYVRQSTSSHGDRVKAILSKSTQMAYVDGKNGIVER